MSLAGSVVTLTKLAHLLPLTVEEDELVGDGIHAEHHVTALLAHFVKRNWRRSISIEATLSFMRIPTGPN